MQDFERSPSRRDYLFGRLLEYLKKAEYHTVTVDYEDYHVYMRLGLKGKMSSCKLHMATSSFGIHSWLFAPIKAAEEAYSDVAELITRMNWSFDQVRFEFSYETGEICCHAYLRSSVGEAAFDDIEYLITTPGECMEKFGDALVKNMMGFGEPEKDYEGLVRKN